MGMSLLCFLVLHGAKKRENVTKNQFCFPSTRKVEKRSAKLLNKLHYILLNMGFRVVT